MQQNINKIPQEKRHTLCCRMQRTLFLQSVKLVLHCIPENRQTEIAIHWNYIYSNNQLFQKSGGQ